MTERACRQGKKPESGRQGHRARPQRTPVPGPVDPAVSRLVTLQHAAGNQAVQRMLKSGALRAKLRIGRTDDVFEHEADRVADRVMRMPKPAIRRKCPDGTPCPLPEDEDHRKGLVQRTPAPSAGEGGMAPDSLLGDLGTGHALDEETLSFMQPRFGYDLRQVRVYHDSRAAESARSIQARAFTAGKSIVFGECQYQPRTAEGRHLLAHELAHTLQQSGSLTGAEPPARGTPGQDTDNAPDARASRAEPASTIPKMMIPVPETKRADAASAVPTAMPRPAGMIAAADSPGQAAGEPVPGPFPAAQKGDAGPEEARSDAIPPEIGMTAGGGGSPTDGEATAQVRLVSAECSRNEAEVRQIAAAQRTLAASFFSGVRKGIADQFGRSVAGIQAFLAAKQAEAISVSTGVLRGVQSAIIGALGTAEALGGRIRDTLYGAAARITASLQGKVAGITGQIISVINTIPLPDLPGIAQLRAAAVRILQRASGAVTGGLNRVLGFVGSVLDTGMGIVRSILGTLRTMSHRAISLISGGIRNIIQSIFLYLGRAAARIVSVLQTVLGRSLLPFLNRLETITSRAADALQQRVISLLRTGCRRLKVLIARGAAHPAPGRKQPGMAGGPVRTIAEVAREVIRANRTIIRLFEKGLFETIRSVLRNVTAVTGLIVSHLGTTIVRVLQAVAGSIGKVTESLHQVLQEAGGFVRTLVAEFQDGLASVVRFVSSLIQDPVDQLVRFAERTLERIRDIVRSLVRDFISSGGTLLSGISGATGDFDLMPGPVTQPQHFSGSGAAAKLATIPGIVLGVIAFLAASPYISVVTMALVGIVLALISPLLSVVISLLLLMPVLLPILAIVLIIILLITTVRLHPGLLSGLIESITVAGTPPPRTRTTIGVGEEVNLNYKGGAVLWNVNGGGDIKGMGRHALLTAPDTGGKIRVTAGRAEKEFDVKEPSGVFLELESGVLHNVYDRTPHANRPDSGLVISGVYLQPDTVNFYHCHFREVQVAAKGSGVYQCLEGTTHCNGPCRESSATGTVRAGRGTEVDTKDCAYSGDCPLEKYPFGKDGEIAFEIPAEYNVAGKPFHKFCTLHQEHTLKGDTLTARKGDKRDQIKVTDGRVTHQRCP